MVVTVDLACGKYPRGTLNYTLYGKATCEATPQLDPFLEKYYFRHNPNALVIEQDITHLSKKAFRNANVLMSHVIEHLEFPYEMLKVIASGNPNLLVVVCPNARTNEADRFDPDHIYSFTQWSMNNMLRRHFEYVRVETVINNTDILALASHKPLQ